MAQRATTSLLYNIVATSITLLDGSNLFAGGPIISTDTTQSTNKDSGAIITDGGVGIEKNINVGGDATITGDLIVGGTASITGEVDFLDSLHIQDTTISLNKDSGCAVFEGGIGVEKDSTFGPASGGGSATFIRTNDASKALYLISGGHVTADLLTIRNANNTVATYSAIVSQFGNLNVEYSRINFIVGSNTLGLENGTIDFIQQSVGVATSFLDMITTSSIPTVNAKVKLNVGRNSSGTPSTTAGIISNFGGYTFTDNATAGSGTATANYFNFIKRDTLAASNALVTTTDAASLYIDNSPLAGTNQTITNAYALLIGAGLSKIKDRLVVTGNSTTAFNVENTSAASKFSVDTNNQIIHAASALSVEGYSSGSPTVTGIGIRATGFTFTDTVTAGSGTTASEMFHAFARPTLAATNSSVTTTNSATVYIANAPLAGTNQTITNAYALLVAAGTAGLTDLSLSGNVTSKVNILSNGLYLSNPTKPGPYFHLATSNFVDDNAVLPASSIITRFMTGTLTAARTKALPAATDLYAQFETQTTNMSFDLYLFPSAFNLILDTNTGVLQYGNQTVTANTIAHFLIHFNTSSQYWCMRIS